MHPSPTTTFLAAGLDGVVRMNRPGLEEIPTVSLAFLAKQPSMPADWIADARAELERRRDEAAEYCGQNRPHGGEALRLPSGYRLFGGEA